MIRCDTKSDYELLYKLQRESSQYQTLLKEHQQLQNNWNKLKEWLKLVQDYHILQKGCVSDEFNYSLESEDIDVLGDVLHKMQELEGNNGK